MEISIIICTFNGADKIEKTLQSILSQKTTCTRELIVVDNASTDGVGTLVNKFLTDHQIDDFSWKVIQEPTPGLINARLAGMKAAASDIMLFCDDDNTLCETYIQTGFDIMYRNPKIGVLGGLGIPEFESAKPEWFDTYFHSYAVGAQADKDGKIEKYPAEVYGAGSFFRKAPLQRFYDLGFVSMFKGRTGKVLAAGDDVEWCFLLQLAGYEIWYNSHLTFLHFMPKNRLTWDYYIKMKSGISSGAASFFIYSQVFKKKDIGFSKYIFLYLSRMSRYAYLYIKYSILHLIVSDKRNYLLRKTIESKLISFIKRFRSSYSEYIRIKILIS